MGPWLSELSNLKNSIVELGQCNLLSVYESTFANMPISQEMLNRF